MVRQWWWCVLIDKGLDGRVCIDICPVASSLVVFYLPLAGCYILMDGLSFELRPYKRKITGSRPISAVKPVMALSVLWWGTTWEYRVL
jgi:hypothetical protein